MGKFDYCLSLGVVLLVTAFIGNAQEWVDGTVYKYISDGCWCWFQDERAVVDTAKSKLIIGSANMQNSVDATIFNIKTKAVENTKRFGNLDYSDDHNSPAVIVAPNGNYIAVWAHHYDKYKHHYSINTGNGWSSEKTFDWNNIPGGTDYTIAYSNLYYLSDEERIYNFSRANDKAPNFLYSEDNGGTWNFGGQLTTNNSNTYNKGYYKYWGNGVDRIDMVFTEEHPRDQTTSIYHGYIQGGKTYNTKGEVADEDIYDREEMPTFESFTKVFAHGTEVNGVTMGRCWQHDLARYQDGSIAILFKARANNEIDDHRNFYARYDGTEWKYTYIGKAGKHIYGNEHDYVGLGSLNPDDPTRIYICSVFNPGDDDAAPASKREIWRGTSTDFGTTWEWEPVTANSSKDNWRPIVPQWKAGNEALLWFRGNYQDAQHVYSEVVGTFYEYDPPVITGVAHTSKLTKMTAASFRCMPAVHRVTMQYQVQPEASTVTLSVFSLSGKKVATLLHGKKSVGKHYSDWSTATVPAGIYFARLTIGTSTHGALFSVAH